MRHDVWYSLRGDVPNGTGNMDFFDDRSLLGGTRRVHPSGRWAPPLPQRDAVVGEARLAEVRAGWGSGGAAPLLVEIGFARPHFLTAAAAVRPHARFLGFEIRSAWCLRLLGEIDRHGWSHVRLVRGDFREFARDLLGPGSVTAFFVHFPDPWWKQRHARKRLVDQGFVHAAGHFLAPGGFLSFRTDVDWYFQAVRELFLADGGFVEGPEPAWCAGFPTHRQSVCQREGTPTFATAFYKTTGGHAPAQNHGGEQ